MYSGIQNYLKEALSALFTILQTRRCGSNQEAKIFATEAAILVVVSFVLQSTYSGCVFTQTSVNKLNTSVLQLQKSVNVEGYVEV